MADHRQLVLPLSATMNVAVAPAHRAFDRTEIRPHYIEQRFAKCGTPGLIANQRAEHIALLQEHSARRADCFLAAPEIHAANDHAAAIKTREFVFEQTREQHPA